MTHTHTPFFSVIIPVYNDPQRLKVCLNALEYQTYPPDKYEVIVIDNGSDMPIDSIVQSFSHARAEYEPQPTSYAARNRGIELAKGDIIAFTDADCIPASNWLEQASQAIQVMPDSGLIAGKICVFYRDPHYPTPAEVYDAMENLQQQRSIAKGNFGVTANVITSRTVIEKIGGFNGKLQSGGDREWGQRVFAAGYKLMYVDDIVVHHPARYTVKELTIKAIRVMKGLHVLRVAPMSPGQIMKDFTPPVSSMLAVMRNPQINGWLFKAQVALIFLYMKYLQGWWRIRLWWHDRSSQPAERDAQ